MRRNVLLLTLSLAVGLLGIRGAGLASAANAGPRDPAPSPTPAPVDPPKPAPSVEPRAVRPAYLAAVRRAPVKVGALGGGFSPPYGEGPIDFEVDVENPQPVALDGTLVVEREGTGAPLARVKVEAAAGGKTKVSFTDPLGLKDGCGPTRDRLVLESTNASSPRTMRVMPSCTFASETSEAQDRREARRGKLSVHGAALASSLACGAPLVVRAVVRNETKERVSGLLRLDGFGSGDRDVGAKAFTVRAGAETPVEITVPAFHGQVGPHALVLEAAAPRDEVPVYQSAWTLRVKRECSLDVRLEDRDAP